MKALELADMVERYNAGVMSQAICEDYLKAAAELRRLAAVEAELERIKALEPVMVYHGVCTIDCGEHGHHDVEMLKMTPAGTKLYALGSKT